MLLESAYGLQEVLKGQQMNLDSLDPVKVHSLLLQPRKDASASIEQYINTNLI
jgi:hypothetical protein